MSVDSITLKLLIHSSHHTAQARAELDHSQFDKESQGCTQNLVLVKKCSFDFLALYWCRDCFLLNFQSKEKRCSCAQGQSTATLFIL